MKKWVLKNSKRGLELPEILFEDEYIIAVNKPAGMLAQTDSTGRQSLQAQITYYLKEHTSGSDELYCAALHRLDRPVSGVMLFAKTPVAAGRLSDDIKNRNIRKFYCALVNTAQENIQNHQWIELKQFMVRRRDRGYIAAENEPGASAVSLRYRIMEAEGSSGLVLIELITGKRHQIRVQLSSIGMPITGDRFYGSQQKLEEGIIALHAHYICFTHPVTKEPATVTAPIPGYMTDRIIHLPEPADYSENQGL